MGNETKNIVDLKEKLLAEFNTFEKNLNGAASTPINNIRKEARDYFETLGFPDRKAEEWKYTRANSITKYDFSQSFSKEESDISEIDVEKLLVPDLETNTIVLINGRYSNELSKIISDPKEVFVCGFSEAQKSHPQIFNNHFAKYADYKIDGFTALNTAFANNGVFIYVPKDVELKVPLLLINIIDSKTPNLLSQQRNLIVAEKGSRISIIDSYETIGNNYNFLNTVTEISADEKSNVHYYKIQNDGNKNIHVGTTQVHQEKDSHFNSVTLSWGGNIIRNNLNSLLNGTGCECHMYGAFVLSGEQHVDNHTLVDHSVPNCFSNELYKGILDDTSTGVFNGKVMVRKDAQKTNAYQSNKNILLTDTATINTKPQLEIFADDVKCSHGATTGQLNKEELFYLRTRGIGEDEAMAMLLYAFASEVIQTIEISPLRNILFDKLNEKLKRG